MASTQRILFGLVLLFGCWLAPAVSRAEEEPTPAAEDGGGATEARRLYGEAKKALSAKKYSEAALGFEAASRIKAHAVALYTAAQAWELAGEKARAADAYSRALATPQLSESQTERSKDRLQALEKDLGTAKVIGKSGTKVTLDDHMEMTVPATVHGSAGAHVLSVTLSDGSTEKRALNFIAGQSQEVNLDEAPEPQPDMPAPKAVKLAEPKKHAVKADTASQPSSFWKTFGFVATGAGVAALGGAVLVGTSAKDAEDTYKARPSRETLDHARGLETRTNILLIGGGVLAAGGIGILVWQGTKGSEKQSAMRVNLGPRDVSFAGSF
jgi:hypothetical protein